LFEEDLEGKTSLSRKQRQTDFNLLISLCQENFLENFPQRRKGAKKGPEL